MALHTSRQTSSSGLYQSGAPVCVALSPPETGTSLPFSSLTVSGAGEPSSPVTVVASSSPFSSLTVSGAGEPSSPVTVSYYIKTGWAYSRNYTLLAITNN